MAIPTPETIPPTPGPIPPTPTPTSMPSTPTPMPTPTLVPVAVGEGLEVGSVTLVSNWVSDELASFRAALAPWEEATGGTLVTDGTRDVEAVLLTRLRVGNAPDVAILPYSRDSPLPFMRQLAKAGQLQRLDVLLDMDKIRFEYSDAWIDLGTVDGGLYAIFLGSPPFGPFSYNPEHFFGAFSKSVVWYNPKQFEANKWEVPWGRMAIVDTKPFKLRVILHRIFVERPQVTGIPAWPGGAACYRRSRYIL